IRTMHSSGRPASTVPILKSPGQVDCFALVIWAISEWPEPWLNASELSTRAGRRLLAGESVKGKGTTTTSHGSQVTERLVVFRRVPLVGHCGGKGAVPPRVKGFHLSNHNHPVLLELVCNYVACMHLQTFPDLLRNSYLTLRSNLAGLHPCTSRLHPYVLTFMHYYVKDSMAFLLVQGLI